MYYFLFNVQILLPPHLFPFLVCAGTSGWFRSHFRTQETKCELPLCFCRCCGQQGIPLLACLVCYHALFWCLWGLKKAQKIPNPHPNTWSSLLSLADGKTFHWHLHLQSQYPDLRTFCSSEASLKIHIPFSDLFWVGKTDSF